MFLCVLTKQVHSSKMHNALYALHVALYALCTALRALYCAARCTLRCAHIITAGLSGAISVLSRNLLCSGVIYHIGYKLRERQQISRFS